MFGISKILTLNKIHILEMVETGSEIGSHPLIDFFHLGAPIIDPPYIRGSMVLQLDLGFLYDNVEFFEYGSPIDTGAVRFGLLNPPERDAFLAASMCDAEKFVRLVADLQALPADVLERVVQHRSCAAAGDVLLRYFDRRVVEFMIATDEPNAWMFEFALRRGYRVRAAHISTLQYPNTYSRDPVFSKVKGLIGKKATQFNPRRGIESR